MDREKIISGWERCKVCDTSLIASAEGQRAYIECEYTTGMYCRRDQLIRDTLTLLKEQPEIVRCQDCAKSDECANPKLREDNVWCDMFDMPVERNWFCADGKRK